MPSLGKEQSVLEVAVSGKAVVDLWDKLELKGDRKGKIRWKLSKMCIWRRRLDKILLSVCSSWKRAMRDWFDFTERPGLIRKDCATTPAELRCERKETKIREKVIFA